MSKKRAKKKGRITSKRRRLSPKSKRQRSSRKKGGRRKIENQKLVSTPKKKIKVKMSIKAGKRILRMIIGKVLYYGVSTSS